MRSACCRKRDNKVNAAASDEGSNPTSPRKRVDPKLGRTVTVYKSEAQRRDERTRFLWRKLRKHVQKITRQVSILSR